MWQKIVSISLCLSMIFSNLGGAKPLLRSSSEEEDVVIVLDPGHDDHHVRNHKKLGVNEQDLNIAIGLACRDRLNEYAGVKVYMTREDGTCPDTANNYKDCITARTNVGKDKKCDLYVSMHCNGVSETIGTSAKGSVIYITNYKKYTEDERKLANLFLNNLNKVGFYKRGITVLTDKTKGTYNDGNVKDKFYLLSNCIDNGFPSILIEHGFMDNSHDNKMFKDKEKLKEMGIADADALAEYYGLKLKSEVTETPEDRIIKGTCQMPYENGGYLIGVETYDNPDKDYQYEILILDCSIMQWVYTTGKIKTEGNSLWTVWQPQYGYYWTLFRVYDKDDNLLDEICYGFQNI